MQKWCGRAKFLAVSVGCLRGNADITPAHRRAVAIQLQATAVDLLPPAPGQPHRAHRFAGNRPTGASNARHGNGPLRRGMVQRALHHGFGHSLADGAVLHDQLSEQSIPAGAKLLMIPAASGIVTGFLSTTISSLKV